MCAGGEKLHSTRLVQGILKFFTAWKELNGIRMNARGQQGACLKGRPRHVVQSNSEVVSLEHEQAP